MEATRIWTGLGVVDTIYEDEDEDTSTTTLSVSPSSTPLHSRVEAWSLATGHDPDVVLHIQNSRFCLHKDPLTTRSSYLRRHLRSLTELIVSPPLKITTETFTLVAEFCYGAHLVVTPFNVVSLRIAAELLEMTEVNGELDENLRQKTEVYFLRAVSVNREYASIVLRTCLTLLPEAETMASLVIRCIEALSLTGDVDGVMRCFSAVKDVPVQDFELIVDSMSQRLTGSHDLLYKIVDLYLKEHNGKMRDEEKSRMSNYIDCTSLSPQLLMHAVQNPRMPLRFVVQAMFVEQLNTRRSIVSAAHDHHHVGKKKHDQTKNAVTLGAILQRDAALRQVAQLKAAMNATSSRIESLENELTGMRQLLDDSNSIKNRLDSGRSASFRFSSENKIERGQVGSVSSASFRIISGTDRAGGTSSSEGSYSYEESPRLEKRFSRRLLNGLRKTFRVSNFLSKNKSAENQAAAKSNEDGAKDRDEETHEDVIVIKKDIPFRNKSSN